MLRDARTRGLFLLLIAAGCGAESFDRVGITPGMPDATDPGSTGSGGTTEIPGGGSGGMMEGSGGAGSDSISDGGSGGAAVVDAADTDTKPNPGADAAPAAPFECNQVLGGNATAQWWTTFEAALDSAHWQLISQQGAYIELWASPTYQSWAKVATSPCASGTRTPDRVLLVVYSNMLRTLDAFRMNIARAIATVRMKYPAVKHIELLPSVRGPGNQPCPGISSFAVVPPYVDQAIEEAAAGSMGLVTAGPKIEVKDCTWWRAPNTDLSPAGAVGVGQSYAAYYKDHL